MEVERLKAQRTTQGQGWQPANYGGAATCNQACAYKEEFNPPKAADDKFTPADSASASAVWRWTCKTKDEVGGAAQGSECKPTPVGLDEQEKLALTDYWASLEDLRSGTGMSQKKGDAGAGSKEKARIDASASLLAGARRAARVTELQELLKLAVYESGCFKDTAGAEYGNALANTCTASGKYEYKTDKY